MNEPRDLVQRLEKQPLLPKGDGGSRASRQIVPDAGINETHPTVLRAREPDAQTSIESHSPV